MRGSGKGVLTPPLCGSLLTAGFAGVWCWEMKTNSLCCINTFITGMVPLLGVCFPAAQRKKGKAFLGVCVPLLSVVLSKDQV